MSGYEELIAGKATPEPQTVDAPPAAEVVVEQAPAPEPVQTSEAPPVAAPAAPEAAPAPQDHSVPLNVLLRTREEFGGKLTAAEQRAAAAERQLAEIRRREEEAKSNVEIPHPLDDPDGWQASMLQLQRRAVEQAVGPLREQHQQQLEVLSRTMMVRHLGQEKFSELEQFMNAAPDQAHAIALKQADPYGWFYDKFQEAQEHRKREETLKQLGGKTVEELVAERVAAELAKHQAQPVVEQPHTAPAADTRERNPDGTFKPSNQTQRHQPPSLSVVAAAPAPRGHEALSGYDMLTKKRG